MNDTVQKLMTLADEWADECGGCDSGHLAAHSKRRQALQDELTRLFTPLTDEPVHQHKWFKTGAMEPGEWRCIDCGEWGKENQHGITGESKRCPLCNYQHGHQIGCENNPVDIALQRGITGEKNETT